MCPQREWWKKREIQGGGLDGRLMAKFLITTIQVNLVPSLRWQIRNDCHPELLQFNFFVNIIAIPKLFSPWLSWGHTHFILD